MLTVKEQTFGNFAICIPVARVPRLSRHALLESALRCYVRVQDLSRARQDVCDRVDAPLLAFSNALFCSTPLMLPVNP